MNNTTEKITGVVKWYNPTKGYGIVSLENRIDDLVFVADQQANIKQGNKVSCEVLSNATGLKVLQINNL